MKRIITAIDNSEINEKLKNEYEIICKDISYKEGILEQIEIEKKIDTIIIDEKIDGNIEINILVKKIKEKIKNIKIIIITENKNKILNKLKRYKRIKIYETNKIKIKKLINLIETDSENEEKEKINNNDKKEKNIIIFSGADNVGKTMISIIFSMISLNSNNLLIDLNSKLNYDISTIFEIQKEDSIKKIDKNLDIMITNKIIKINEEIKKNNYNNIIIDLGNNIENEKKKIILNQSNKIIFLIEPNILGLKKAKKIIELYLEKIKINKEKLFIIINKKNKNSIDEKIIKELFKGIKIIGIIEVDENYDKLMNCKFRNLKILMNKKNYIKISKKILN